MRNIMTFESWFSKSGINREDVEKDVILSEIEENKLENKKRREDLTRKSLLIAQKNGSPTYYDHTTEKTEVTNGIDSKRKALSNVRNENIK